MRPRAVRDDVARPPCPEIRDLRSITQQQKNCPSAHTSQQGAYLCGACGGRLSDSIRALALLCCSGQQRADSTTTLSTARRKEEDLDRGGQDQLD